MTLETKNLDLLTATVLDHLPDGIEERKRLLVTLHATLPRTYRHREEIEGLIHHLQAHQRHQMEFRALLNSKTQP
jgi:hypothetical protein